MISIVNLFFGALLCSTTSAQQQETVTVKYGYFTEARPFHAACATGWFDLNTTITSYKVECYPQASGNFVASRLDNLQLDIAGLGSTPLAQAIARGIDIKVIYIAQQKGDSEGIYVRQSSGNYTGIGGPLDLRGRTMGVPFGSTSHYQLLFLIDHLGLTGFVNLKNLSPADIKAGWDDGTIDGAACWGDARDYILGSAESPGRTLVTAQTIADWGAGISTDVVVARTFARDHEEFVDHFVGVMSRLTDSYIDRLGVKDPANAERWATSMDTGGEDDPNLLLSMVDALMLRNETPQQPSIEAILAQLRALELFVQAKACDQVSCDMLGPGSQDTCPLPPLHIDLVRQNAEFLVDQKSLPDLGWFASYEDNTDCWSGVFDASHLFRALGSLCDGNDKLLLDLEEKNKASGRGSFALKEVDRSGLGDSTCSRIKTMVLKNGTSPVTGSFGDGANASMGKSYSDNLNCRWVVRGTDCDDTNSTCDKMVELRVIDMRVWSGDFVRIYEHDDMNCYSESGVLLAQLSHVTDRLPPFRAKGCISVTFETDSNQERVYAGDTGDGFLLDFDRDAIGCRSSSDCSGSGTCSEGICECDENSWGGDCSYSSQCLGTRRVRVSGSKPSVVKSAAATGPRFLHANKDAAPLDTSTAYSNDLDCKFIFDTAGSGSDYVAITIFYDLEPGFDYLRLESGLGVTAEPYAVLTGQSSDYERYYLKVDSSGLATLQLKTDSLGRRLGFHATVEGIKEENIYDACQEDDMLGAGGNFCEFDYCVSSNKLSASNEKNSIGRLISQRSGIPLRPMPWAPDGGCVWMLSRDMLQDSAAIRLKFNDLGLDLESQQPEAVGDGVIVTIGGETTILFRQECKEDNDCDSSSRFWQTGVCNPEQGCEVEPFIEIDIKDPSKPGQVAIFSDHNDRQKFHGGPDILFLAVDKCETEQHCEDVGGTCTDYINGLKRICTCRDGNPCSCSCDGPPNGNPGGPNFNVVIPVFVTIFMIFTVLLATLVLVYRAKERKLKETIKHFQNSIFGLRSAIKDHVPNSSLAFEGDTPMEQPQLVLVKGDVIQISKQQNAGLAFGTKLYHADEKKARALQEQGNRYSDKVYIDSGWLPQDVIEVPTGDDLEDLIQKFGDTGFLKTPESWDPVTGNADVAKRYELSKKTVEYGEVVEAFMSTQALPGCNTSFGVQRIERIQNLPMWQSYNVKLQTILYRDTGFFARKPRERLERRWLWHGSDYNSIEKIIQQGFNRSFCGRNGTRYGKGVYFARDSCYAAEFAKLHDDGLQYMLACRVVVGEYCEGEEDALIPDVRNSRKHILYDSTCDCKTNPSLYVTYHDAQAYPEYLVVFETWGSSGAV